MYDDDVQAPLSLGATDRYYKVAKFPTRNIKTPIVLVYGGSDSLVDIKVMLKELPHHTIAREIPHFEHLDFLWGQEVESLVFPHVFEALTAYSGRNHLTFIDFPEKTVRNDRLAITETSEDDFSSPMSDNGPKTSHHLAKNNTTTAKPSSARISPSTPRNRRYMSPPSSSSTDQTSTSMDGAGDARPSSRAKQSSSILGRSLKHTRNRSGSMSSTRSVDSSKKFGDAGISVGFGKATTLISTPTPLSRGAERESKPKT